MSEQPLLEARKIVKSLAFNALEGKPTTKKIGTEPVSITEDNLSENQDNLYKPSC